MLETIFDFDLGPPPPRVPGEGPDGYFPLGISRFGPDPGGLIYL